MNLFKIFSFFALFLTNTVDSIPMNNMDKYQEYIHKYNKDFSYENYFIFKNKM